MRMNIQEKLLKIADDIGEHGSVNLTRLVVLKKWLEKPERLSAFAIWIAARATSRKGKASGAAAGLFREASALLAGVDECHPQLDREKARALHHRLRGLPSEYRKQRWGVVRIVHNWNLMLVEHALAIHLWHANSPAEGYKLAADYCQNFDSRYGNGLNGPSHTKIEELVRFVRTVEASESNPPAKPSSVA